MKNAQFANTIAALSASLVIGAAGTALAQEIDGAVDAEIEATETTELDVMLESEETFGQDDVIVGGETEINSSSFAAEAEGELDAAMDADMDAEAEADADAEVEVDADTDEAEDDVDAELETDIEADVATPDFK